jgi:hypothetical protein
MDVRPGRHIEYDQLEEEPTYRVHFWHMKAGWAPSLDSHILAGANDVREAVEWAELNSAGRPWELFALLEVYRALGTDPENWWIQLCGTSPLKPDALRDPESTALSFERASPAE